MKINLIILFSFVLISFAGCGEKTNEQTENANSEVKADTSEFYAFIKNFNTSDSGIEIELDKISISESIDSIEDGSPIIKNEETEIEKHTIDPNAAITMETLNHNNTGNFNFNEKITAEEFIKLFSKPEFEHYRFTPFEIKTANNKIISIKEKYLP